MGAEALKGEALDETQQLMLSARHVDTLHGTYQVLLIWSLCCWRCQVGDIIDLQCISAGIPVRHSVDHAHPFSVLAP